MERETLLDIFRIAIENENGAYEFYKKAAAGISDPEIKKLFEELANTELIHEGRLKERYKELRETTSWKET